MTLINPRLKFQIKTNRVKELVLRRNRFTHVPLPGLEIVAADRLVITDNYFHRISAGSVDVKSAKEVEVINNQFSVNAIQVVRSSEGSRLYISCNRLENIFKQAHISTSVWSLPCVCLILIQCKLTSLQQVSLFTFDKVYKVGTLLF